MSFHPRIFILLCVVAAFSCGGILRASEAGDSRAPIPASLKPTPEELDARLGWWREARFGMFVHWGVYSGLGGTWKGEEIKGYAEHIQRLLKIPHSEYLKEVAGKFNPTEFNADEWVRLAREAGMGYLIITAKHHDGFAMFDSKVNDYTIVKATPFARDPMPELRAACRKYGLKFGFYYSQAFDWESPDAPGNDWDYQNPGGDRHLFGLNWWEKDPAFLTHAQKYVDEKAIPQILELIKNYDPDIFWFDTPQKLPVEENLRILAAVRKAKPSLVISGRLVRRLGDYESSTDRPAEFPPHKQDWEGIPTTNESFGYNANDQSYKPPEHFIRLLAKAAARGGNILMNVGPMGNGQINPTDVSILQGIGRWWAINGSSIRGTTATPLPVQAWGESTRKGNELFLHVFRWPEDGHLVVGGLKSEVSHAALLSDPEVPLKVIRRGVDVVLDIPKTAPDQTDSVIALTCASPIEVDRACLLSPTQTNELRAFDGRITRHLEYGDGKEAHAWVSNWTALDAAVTWPVRLEQKTTFEVAIVYDAPAATPAKKVNGDTGEEMAKPEAAAGGTFQVALGKQTLSGSVETGSKVTTKLGRITLDSGSFDLRVAATQITGPELMRLRSVILTPVAEP